MVQSFQVFRTVFTVVSVMFRVGRVVSRMLLHLQLSATATEDNGRRELLESETT